MAEPAIVCEFGSRTDAELAREMLVANGIEAFVISDDCGSVDPALTFARGARVMVAAEDLEAALKLLAEVPAGEPNAGGAADAC